MTRSPQRLKDQVREAVSELPIHAARLAVMGVGRALLLTDRVRKDYREAREAGLGPVIGRLRNDAGNLIGKVTSRPAEPPAPESEIVVGKPEPTVPPPRPKPAAAPPEPAAAPAEPAAPPEAAAELPVPGYDEASIASVRARPPDRDADP